MTLDEVIRSNSISFTLWATGIVFILTVISFFLSQKGEIVKYIFFALFTIIILANTFYLVGSTVVLNMLSVTGGPVHYHADIEFWVCGKEYELVDPKGLSNRIGTPVLHEHNDKRIHIEGVVLNKKDISLGRFLEVVGGKISSDSLIIPTPSGEKTIANGDECNGEVGVLQAFVYTTSNNIYAQKKIDNPTEYVLSAHSQVPPGDCIIVEFDRIKDKTDKLCLQYKVKEDLGEIKYGD